MEESNGFLCRLEFPLDGIGAGRQKSAHGSTTKFVEGEIFMIMNQGLIEKIVGFAKSYGATRLILFGSALERPEDANDIDIACDGIDGWKLYEMAARLEEELGASFDVVPLSPPTRFTRIIEIKGKTIL